MVGLVGRKNQARVVYRKKFIPRVVIILTPLGENLPWKQIMLKRPKEQMQKILLGVGKKWQCEKKKKTS